MELIEGVALSKLCDYSFGDQAGQWSRIYTHFMKDANLLNVEFASKVFSIQKKRDYMTLFIDNIRLYKRDIAEVKESDKPIVNAMMNTSNLLDLCSNFPDMRFIIFTNLEDTPIDDAIFDCIPDNVLRICAVNAVANGGKVVPAPYGVQRKMHRNDDRIEKLVKVINDSQIGHTENLLYVSHNESSHESRKGTKAMFADKSWATVDVERVEYGKFLRNLSNHQFMLCPRGNAIDCHRNWEVVYMRRVPIMMRDEYLQTLFKDYPVLWVDDFSEVTEELLKNNSNLMVEAHMTDLSGLNLGSWYNKMIEEVV